MTVLQENPGTTLGAVDPATSLAIPGAAADLLFRHASTAYGFTDEPVTAAELAAVHDLMQWAPTAMNSNPLRIVFVASAEGKARLRPHVAEGNLAKFDSAPVTAILAADTDFHETIDRLNPHLPGVSARFADPTRREQMARFNATLQAGYFLIAVRAVGLDAGPMGGYDATGVDRDVLGDGPLKSLMLVNIGHVASDGTYPRGPRLHRDEAVRVL